MSEVISIGNTAKLGKFASVASKSMEIAQSFKSLLAGDGDEKTAQKIVSAQKDLASELSNLISGGGAASAEIYASKSVNAMNITEYKTYIRVRISSFSLARAGDGYSINISEAGFAAMKASASYEEWVLEQIRTDMDGSRLTEAFAGGAIPKWSKDLGGDLLHLLDFGASPEDKRERVFAASDPRGASEGEGHEKESFWSNGEERAVRRRAMKEKAQERRENFAAAQEERYEKRREAIQI